MRILKKSYGFFVLVKAKQRIVSTNLKIRVIIIYRKKCVFYKRFLV